MATAPSAISPPVSRWRRCLRLILVLMVVPYLGLLILMAIFQRSLIYFPRRAAPLPLSQARLPNASVEAIRARTDDGLELHGWWFTAHDGKATGRDSSESTRGSDNLLVLYFCGNAGHRGYRIPEFDLLTTRGADVLCCDYRGYGENGGSPSEAGLAIDAHAVWKFATDDRRIPPRRIVLFGESLGGAVAIRLASELCAAGTPPAGLITRSTFSELADVAAIAFPWVPARGLLRDRFASIERIGRVTCPLVLIHGERDSIVPFPLGMKLFEAAPEHSSSPEHSTSRVPKRLVALPSSDHNDILETDERGFVAAIDAFLRELLPSRPGESSP